MCSGEIVCSGDFGGGEFDKWEDFFIIHISCVHELWENILNAALLWLQCAICFEKKLCFIGFVCIKIHTVFVWYLIAERFWAMFLSVYLPLILSCTWILYLKNSNCNSRVVSCGLRFSCHWPLLFSVGGCHWCWEASC